MPVALMEQVITQKEYFGWVDYLNEPDIQELQMAHFMTLVASASGAKNVKMSDFLIRSPSNKVKPNNTIMSANEVSSIFGGVSTKG